MNEVGYRRPPASTRFTKGKSGNPKGRPLRRHKRPPYDVVLGRMMIVREDGIERRVTAAEAFLLHIAKRGLDGDGAAARAAIAAIEDARAARPQSSPEHVKEFTFKLDFVGPGNVNMALRPLGMATKLDRFRDTARMALEPWLVEAALERLDERRLTPAEQAKVVEATRTPYKVRWPDWWEHKPQRS